MKAKLISTQGEYLESVLKIEGKEIHVMDGFSVNINTCPDVGDEFDFVFSNYPNEDEPWESMFSSNPEKKVGIEQITGWTYRCYGKIIQINPVIVDCGLFKEEDVIYSNDEKVIGEYIAFTISCLCGYAR